MGDRRSRWVAAIVAVAAAAGAQSAAAIPPPPGGLTETQCISETAGNGCVGGDGIGNARMVAVSPDGKNVYVASATGGGGAAGAVAAFSRDPTTGALTELNCVAATAGNGCTSAAAGLTAAWGVAVSPDGATIYVTSPTFGGGSVAAFVRDPNTGAIGAQIDCFSENATGPCIDGHGLDAAKGVAASNAAVYVAASGPNGSLASFSRGAGTGGLGLETACFNFGGAFGCGNDQFMRNAIAVAVTPDARTVYAVSASGALLSSVVSHLVDQFGVLSARTGCVVAQTGVPPCADGNNSFADPGDIAIAPDRRVYVAAPDGGNVFAHSGAVVAFSVDTTTLGVTGFINCWETDGFGCPAPFQTNLDIAEGVAVSPDGGQVYVAAQGTDETTGGAVSAYTRNATNGAVGTLINCVGEDAGNGCTAADGLATASFLAMSPDGRHLYLGDANGGGANSGGVTVLSRELAPTCANATATVAAGSTVSIPLQCSDPNGDPITRAVAAGPANGVLDPINQAGGTVTYTASALATGSDSFTFTATDGAVTSAPATASITITQAQTPPVNEAPSSQITGLRSRVNAKSLTKFTGKASDDITVAKVEIAVVQATGGAHAATAKTKHRKPRPACRQLTSKGTFKSSSAKKGKCAPTVWLKATGTTKWTYKLRKRLPPGRYSVYSRATDDAGLKESSFSSARHNRVSFTVTQPRRVPRHR